MRNLKADIAVIGAGSGGLSVAAGAAQLGLKVVLFEMSEMGGDCLNYGCVPSKALIAAGRAAQSQRTSSQFGIAAVEPQVDWVQVQAHVRSVIAAIAPVDSQERFESLGVTVVREAARFTDHATLESASVRVAAKRIVVATGSSPRIPAIPGLAETPHLTNETIFSVSSLPNHLIVLGGGPIGIELGQAFRRLGAKVTIVEAKQALARADAEAASVALARLRQDGVAILEGRTVVRVQSTTAGVEATLDDGASIQGSHLLVALGRSPHLDGLGLAAGNVAHDAAGIHTKPNLRSISNSRVWAVGDVTGRPPFTHSAGWHASVFVRNALFKAPTKADALPIPSVTYCDPEVGQIGLTHAEAAERFGAKRVQITRWSFDENDRAQAERSHDGFLKIITDRKGRLLGASLVGDNAGDILQMIALAMSNGLGIRALTNMIAPYPTRGEIVKRVAGQSFVPVLFSPRTKTLVRVLSAIP